MDLWRLLVISDSSRGLCDATGAARDVPGIEVLMAEVRFVDAASALGDLVLDLHGLVDPPALEVALGRVGATVIHLGRAPEHTRVTS